MASSFKPNRPSSRQRYRLNSENLAYQQLEKRQLLAVDFALNFTGTIFPTDSSAVVPDAQGEISEDYAVEVANGRFLVHDRDTGTRIFSETLDNFFSEAGSTVFTTTQNPRVVYDELSQRFFVAAAEEGTGNWLHVAFSNTSDPTGEWKSLQFVGDSTGVHFNGDLGFAVDADAVYLTTNNYLSSDPDVVDDVSIYSIPKADIFLPNPTLTNMTRFEGLNPEVFGSSIQMASNFEASDGKAVGLGSISVAIKTSIEISGADSADATLAFPERFNVDFGLNDPTHLPEINHDEGPAGEGEIFRDPDNPWQEANEDLTLITKGGFTGSLEEVNGSIFAVQTISFEEIENHTSINWFEYDVATRVVAGSLPIDPLDEIENNIYQTTRAGAELDPFAVDLRGPASHVLRPEAGSASFNYLFNPSIAVNEQGIIAISYNRLTPSEPVGTGVAVGTIANGLNRRSIQIEDDTEWQAGFDTYDLNTQGFDPWGFRGSVQADPASPNSFLLTQPWSNTTDRWTVQNALINVVDLTPVVEADLNDNMVVFRLNETDPTILEVEIDGTVTDSFPFDAVGRVEVWAGAGDDHFLIDYTNGDPSPPRGFAMLGGQGIDTVETNSPEGAEFSMGSRTPDFTLNYPDYLNIYQVSSFGGGLDGIYNETGDMLGIEELLGGPGNDTFIFRENRTLPGSANGGEGDDTFRFVDVVLDPISLAHSGVEEAIIGGPGYDTLDFEERTISTSIEIVGFGATGGFDGRMIAAEEDEVLSIGGFDIEEDDLFLEIEQLIGSTLHENDSFVTQDDRAGMWVIDDDLSHYITMDDDENEVRLDFRQWNSVTASTLADTFHIRNNTVSPLRLNSLAGDDEFVFSSTAPALDGTTENISLVFVRAGEGANRIYASNQGGTAASSPLVLRNRVTGLGDFVYETEGTGTIDMELWGTPFGDFFSLHSYFNKNSLIVRTGDGNDEFSIQDLSKAQIDVYGEGGDDTYVLQRVQGVDFRNLSLIDSVGLESDSVFLAGTSANERFLITSSLFLDVNFVYTGIENFGVDGRRGDDIFEILDYDADLMILGGDGDDQFFFSSDGELLTGNLLGFIDANISIDGGAGNNHLAVSNLSGPTGLDVDIRDSLIEGLWNGNLEFLSTGGVFNTVSGTDGILIIGTDAAADRLDGLRLNADDSLTVDGRGGNDTFFARAAALGDIRMLGGEGNDNHSIVFGQADNRTVEVVDDAVGTNRVTYFGTDGDDVLDVFGNSAQFATEMATVSGNFQTLTVLARGGNDELSLDGAAARITRIFGEDGNDVFFGNGTDGITGLRVLMGTGNDEVYLDSTLETTFTRVLGDAGDDLIEIGEMVKGTVIADGEDGSDHYQVTFARDIARYIKTVDSGVGENDTVLLLGSDEADDVQVRTRRVNLTDPGFAGAEVVVFDGEHEELIVETLGGDDIVNIFGSTADSTVVRTAGGSDSIHVNSSNLAESLSVEAGEGNDTLGVFKVSAETNLTMDGGEGDDHFDVGSDQTADNGNLGFIRGQVNLMGGTNSAFGEDTLYINDRLPAAAYAYDISDTGLSAIPGPNNINRGGFTGIDFDNSFEFVRLDTTDLANYVSVSASTLTRFHIDGNDPGDGSQLDTIELLGLPSSDGRTLNITDPENGEGFWEFANNKLDVAFEDFEVYIDGT